MPKRAREEEEEEYEDASVADGAPETVPFRELAEKHTKSSQPCWLCKYAFRKPTSNTEEPGMSAFYSAYISNRDHTKRAALCELLEEAFEKHIWLPKYDSGELDTHYLTAAQIDLHLATHTRDPIQMVLNALEDIAVDSDILKQETYVRSSQGLIPNMAVLAARAKREEMLLKFIACLQTLRK